jgi:NAD(P)-dependent dehydrogenase (short-subunit alcohol dehydrogenase family)
VVAEVEAKLGPVDILVNSAGAAKRTPPEDLTNESWRAAMDAKYFTYVHAIDAVIKGMAQKKQIAVGIEIGEGLHSVRLDQHKFKQVLYNLLSNAIKFSNDGGEITLRATHLDTAQIEVQVRDTGIERARDAACRRISRKQAVGVEAQSPGHLYPLEAPFVRRLTAW